MDLLQIQDITEHVIKYLLNKNVEDVIKEGRKTIKPPPDIKGSEWADKYMMLPETDEFAGPYDSTRVPHITFLLDLLTNPTVRQISIMASSQAGKTMFLVVCICYWIMMDPSSIQVGFPDETLAKDFAEDKLEAVIEQIPEVYNKIISKKSKDDKKGSTFKKRFLGGHLRIGTMLSRGFLRGRSSKRVLGSDIDNIDVGIKEGDPVLRFIKRSTVYSDYTVIFESSPTIDGSSRIQALYELGNKCEYLVQCPDCGGEFSFDAEKVDCEKDYDAFGRIEKYYPETAYYACPHCSVIIDEKTRREMLKKGNYTPAKGHELIEEHVSVNFNECTSTLSSMKKIMKAIIDAGEDPEKKEALTNTVFGKPYKKTQGERVPWEKLMDLAEPYIDPKNKYLIPDEILYIVMTADVQKDRLEYLVLGVGAEEEVWVLQYDKIYGETEEREVYRKLYGFYKNTIFTREDGIKLTIKSLFVDAGYLQTTVNEFTAGREDSENIWSTKGIGGPKPPLLPNEYSIVSKKTTPAKQLNLGSNAGKSLVYKRLGLTLEKRRGPKTIHFCSAYCDSNFFKQLTSEEKFEIYNGLITYVVYKKINKHDPNEVLDLFYMGFACIKKLKANVSQIKREIEKIKQEMNKPENNTVKTIPVNQRRKRRTISKR